MTETVNNSFPSKQQEKERRAAADPGDGPQRRRSGTGGERRRQSDGVMKSENQSGDRSVISPHEAPFDPSPVSFSISGSDCDFYFESPSDCLHHPTHSLRLFFCCSSKHETLTRLSGYKHVYECNFQNSTNKRVQRLTCSGQLSQNVSVKLASVETSCCDGGGASGTKTSAWSELRNTHVLSEYTRFGRNTPTHSSHSDVLFQTPSRDVELDLV